MPEIRTYCTGRSVSLLWPTAADIAIEDIACALAHQCRYVGHVPWHYSVAQHAWLASHMVPHEAALWALLHDASEAYLGDVSGPLKATPVMRHYRALEALWERVIYERFGLHGPVPSCVQEADEELRRLELAVLHQDGACSAKARIWIDRWESPEIAEVRFLERFHELTAERR